MPIAIFSARFKWSQIYSYKFLEKSWLSKQFPMRRRFRWHAALIHIELVSWGMAEHPKVIKWHVTDKVVSNCLSITFMLGNVEFIVWLQYSVHSAVFKKVYIWRKWSSCCGLPNELPSDARIFFFCRWVPLSLVLVAWTTFLKVDRCRPQIISQPKSYISETASNWGSFGWGLEAGSRWGFCCTLLAAVLSGDPLLHCLAWQWQADRMLDMGFEPQIRKILAKVSFIDVHCW